MRLSRRDVHVMHAGAGTYIRWSSLLARVARGARVAQASTASAAPCDGKMVSAVSITPRDPSFLAFPRRLRPLARGIGLVHTTSTPEVIGRFLLVEPGQRCTERQRSESERILRLQPFLADATVRAVPDGLGGVRIEVETVDEIPTVFALQFRGTRPAALRVGNGNVRGQGLYVAASVARGQAAYRMGVGVNVVAYQTFGRPYTLAMTADRAPLGGAATIALGHAFLTDLQRIAWHVGYVDATSYVSYTRPAEDALSLQVRRQLWDVGSVRRVGIGRRNAFVGFLVTHEEVTPANRFVVVSDSGLIADTATVGGAFVPYRNLRVNAVIGVRALSFLPVRGFDALVAVQDIATGAQLGVLLGRSLAIGTSDDDALVSGDFYAGVGSARSFGALRVQAEARNDRRTKLWDSRIASGRLAWYVKPAAQHVFIGSLEGAGGSRQRVPFQIALGDRQGGVRGYYASRIAGGIRSVARVEERWSLTGITTRVAFGLAGFVEGGRVWAADAPFGVNSAAKVGVGLGVLAAIPAQSQRLWRLDVAVPASPDPYARPELRLTSVWTRVFWQEPTDVARGRAGAAPSTIFVWP